MTDDRRVFERIAAKFPLRFLNPHTGIEGKAETVDFSANGLGFVTEKSLSPNMPLELWLDIPDNRQPLYTRGAVAWSEASAADNNRMRVGVRLERAELMGLARLLWMNN